MTCRIDRFLYQKEKSFWTKTLLLPLYLFSLPYGGAVRARSLFYSFRLLKTETLPCPVISMGNITAGGTGKTPHVMALAKGLMQRGISVAILSRGYKARRSSGSLVSDGHTLLLSPDEAGDEPFLMAQSLMGIPVLIGKDRFANGKIALQRFNIRGLLLDDGYQHLQLHRDLNILLIDSQTGFGDPHLLPRGILREPLSHLSRADLFLLTKVKHPEACQPLETSLHLAYPSVQIFHSHYEPLGLIGPKGEREEIQSLKGKKVIALSGIADPTSFSSLLRTCGMEVVEEVIHPDHYHYRSIDLTNLRKKMNQVDWVVTTEKDMVKLKVFNMDPFPLRALRIGVKLWEEDVFFNRVMELF
jgi:tetraacyldisaccharide 4'-kinase